MTARFKIRARHLAASLTLLALASLYAPAALAGSIYYVDQGHPRASDSNPGSKAKPWKTLYRAAEHALEPGDTVLVRPGRYDVSKGGSWSKPAINPASSGEPGRPIVFRAEPRHEAVLETGGKPGRPAIGVRARHHVVIDGFTISNPGDKGIVVFGTERERATGIVIQNNIIHGVYRDDGDNTDAIRIERASHVTVRNNKIHDVKNGKRSSNAAGIKLYWSDNVVIENNEIFDVIAGIKEKENGEFVDVRRNYIHDCSFGIEVMNQNDMTTQSYRIYENIFDRCSTAVESRTNPTAKMKDIYVYNNVFANYDTKAVTGTRHGEQRRIWNNIFYRTGQVKPADFYTHDDPPEEIVLMDYNLYYQEPTVRVGIYSTRREFRGLADWQRSGYGMDRHSLVADPLFKNPERGDFRLAADSPARKRGRLNGDKNGRRVDIGAFPDGETTIGLTWERERAQAPKVVKVSQ